MKYLLNSNRDVCGIVLLIVMQVCSIAEETSPEKLEIKLDQRQDKGVVSLKVSFRFDKERRIYDWRGHIYPLLGHCLSVEVYDRDGKPLEIEKAAHVMPQLVDKRDVITTKEDYTYREPLVLKLMEDDMKPFEGVCMIRIIYDTTRFEIENDLSELTLESNWIIVEESKSGQGVDRPVEEAKETNEKDGVPTSR